MGAYDGVSSSNTKGFEEEGWTGVCVEPDPRQAVLCRSNRNAKTINGAIGIGNFRQLFYVNTLDRGTSGLLQRETEETFEVSVWGLGYLLFNLGIKQVDLLSIDTEGTELDVWGTRMEYDPSIVIVEFWTQPHPPRDKEIVARFNQDGYQEVHRTTANLIFTKG